jgi:L-cysteine:1D-myo-inositol 2-amino-2-deoxy-alpha-D-glucopyranoside ligase
MPAGGARLERWLAAGVGDGALAEVRAALDDDLDTPRAVAAIDAAVDAGAGAGAAARLLGVDLAVGPPSPR